MTENIPKDIVARLRAPCPRVFACMDSTRAEAADEIERLRERDNLRRAHEKEILRLLDCIEQIAEHHEAQWSHWLNDDMARYHQHRRDVAMAYMTEAAK